MPNAPQVRLYGLLARSSPMGVVFRRGPSRRVLLISWDTRTDTFETGQWFKGRIYERRCDLSPDGSHLIYFAAKYTEPLRTWTAVSRPPYLSAIALWPKGDAWGGGGLFESNSSILLNHPEGERSAQDGLAPPAHVRIRPFGDAPGAGEDDPIAHARLTRDGWQVLDSGRAVERGTGKRWRNWFDFDPPRVLTKRHPHDPQRWELRSVLTGIHEHGGPWYVLRHELIERASGERYDLGPSDWADWVHDGDLAFSAGGKLFRSDPEGYGLAREARTIADFRDLSFAAREPPEEALRW